MLVAVKWRSDFEFWPSMIRKNVQSLPEGFDVVMSVSDYDLHLQSYEAEFLAWKAERAAGVAITSGAEKFVTIRNKWQSIADKFAFENSVLGITQIPGKTKEVADAFSRVVYYLNANAPTEAIKELDLIPRGDIFLTEERISSIKSEFYSFLITL
jgi:hypothetical protein